MHLLAVIGLCLASAFLAVVVMCLLSINRDNRHRATVADLRAQIAALESRCGLRPRPRLKAQPNPAPIREGQAVTAERMAGLGLGRNGQIGRREP